MSTNDNASPSSEAVQAALSLADREKTFSLNTKAERAVVTLAAEVRRLQAEVTRWKSSANFHRDRGITLLDAKWLDPRCHEGCQSLVIGNQLAAHQAALKSAADALDKIANDFIPDNDKDAPLALQEMRSAIAALAQIRALLPKEEKS